MPMVEGYTIQDLFGAARRRKWGFILAFSVVAVTAVFIAFILPPIYRSETAILVEEQQIPQEFVPTTVTSYVEERLQVITQRVLSRTKLLEIIEKFNLYRDIRERLTTEEVVEKMRADIQLKSKKLEGRAGKGPETIAFTLSYEGRSPSTVLKVANELASVYLEENVKTREERAATTTEFLESERERIRTEIEKLEQNISDFKAANIGVLPEYTSINLEALNRLNRDLDQINTQVNNLQDRRVYLQGQLATIPATNPVLNPLAMQDTAANAGPAQRLAQLNLELIRLRAHFSDKHPDVIRLKNEIRELGGEVPEYDAHAANIARLQALQQQAAELQGKYGPKHPDVIALQNEIQNLTTQIGTTISPRTPPKIVASYAPNPAYVNIQTQLVATDMEIRNLQEERVRIKDKLEDYQKRVERAPLVEKDYHGLVRDYDNAQKRYNEVLSRLMEARTAQGMEQAQRGERFTIVEPAQLPQKPYKPNRQAIVLIGLVLAFGAGAGLAGVREALDHSVKTPDELSSLTGLPLLSVVSFMESDEERRVRQKRMLFFVLTSLAAVVVAVIIVHLFFIPWDILLIKLQKRAMLLF